MDKFSSVRTIKLSYKIDQVENGWTVTTVDGTVFIFPDAREMAEWFCMVVGVPFLYSLTLSHLLVWYWKTDITDWPWGVLEGSGIGKRPL